MRCTYCGEEIEENAINCPSCGKAVRKFNGYERETNIIKNIEKEHSYKRIHISNKNKIIIISLLFIVSIVAIIGASLNAKKNTTNNYNSSVSTSDPIAIAQSALENNMDEVLKKAGCASYTTYGSIKYGSCTKESRGDDGYYVTLKGSFYPEDEYGDEHKIQFTATVMVSSGIARDVTCTMASRQY